MNTYPVRDRDGRIIAFEIESVYIGVKKVAKLLLMANGVSDLRVRKLFSANNEIHVEFSYMGTSFIVWEPYADSSRYWIGPKDKLHEQINLGVLERVFQQYQPLFVIKVLGDLVLFKFLSSLRRWIKSVR